MSPDHSQSKAHKSSKASPEITLEHRRNHHLGWAAFGVLAGGALLWKLGVIGQFLGGALLLLAIVNAMRAARTFLHSPGTFLLSDSSEMSIPESLCTGKDLKLGGDKLQHVFFLRRAVPWSKAGPILIVEADGRSFSYPRDWFSSDSDQRRVAAALQRSLTCD